MQIGDFLSIELTEGVSNGYYSSPFRYHLYGRLEAVDVWALTLTGVVPDETGAKKYRKAINPIIIPKASVRSVLVLVNSPELIHELQEVL